MNGKWLRSLFLWTASWTLLMALSMQLPAAAWAQEGAAAKSPAEQGAPKKDSTGQTQEESIIRSNVNVVTTPVTVFDSSGNFVYDLEKEEFKLYDNGELQNIQ